MFDELSIEHIIGVVSGELSEEVLYFSCKLGTEVSDHVVEFGV